MSYVWALTGFFFRTVWDQPEKKQKNQIQHLYHSVQFKVSLNATFAVYQILLSSYMFRSCTRIIVRLAYKRY